MTIRPARALPARVSEMRRAFERVDQLPEVQVARIVCPMRFRVRGLGGCGAPPSLAVSGESWELRLARSAMPVLLGASLFVTGAKPASADDAAAASGKLPVAVLTVLTPDAFEQADALTVALKRALEEVPGYTTADTDQSLQVLELTLGCGDPGASPGTVVPDFACEEKIADRIKQERFIWARITKKRESVKGDLHFFYKGHPTGSAPLDYSANLTVGADETLIQIARAALEQAGAGPAKGKLKVSAGKVTGQVFVDGKKVGDILLGSGEFEVSPGSHKITVKTPEGAEMVSEFTLSPFGTATVSLTPPPPPTKGMDPKIFVGFGLVGAGIGLGIGGLYSTLKVRSIQADFKSTYQANYGTNENACKTKKDPLPLNHNKVLELCNDASQFTTYQEALYPLAGIAAGVGFVLLGVSDWQPNRPVKDKKAASISVEPWVGKDGGFLSVRALF